VFSSVIRSADTIPFSVRDGSTLFSVIDEIELDTIGACLGDGGVHTYGDASDLFVIPDPGAASGAPGAMMVAVWPFIEPPPPVEVTPIDCPRTLDYRTMPLDLDGDIDLGVESGIDLSLEVTDPDHTMEDC
jgi:hypothetical protein